MSISKICRLVSRIFSLDGTWFRHRLRLTIGIRGLVPRPAPLISRCAGRTHSQKVKQEFLPRLLVFSHNLELEGASISLKELICGLKVHHGILSEVIAFGDGPLHREYEQHGISVEVMPSVLHRISTTKRLEKEISLLAKRIQASAADVVFVNTLLNFPAILAAEAAGLPSIWNPRESEPWNSYFRFLPDPVAQQAIAAIGLPRMVVFVSAATRAVWQDFEQFANFQVIHNALNLDRFEKYKFGDKISARADLGWLEGEVVVLCVGTICERKGQIDALLAIEKIIDQLKVDIRLVFAGDASSRYAKKLQRLASVYSDHGRLNIQFVESAEAIGCYYLAADLFLLCSRVESYPRVILEAMSFGLPIITTPVFGIAEQLSGSDCDYFYDPGDINTLAGHFLDLLHNSYQRQQFGMFARNRFNMMPSFVKMLGSYEDVIRQSAVIFD